MSDSVGDLRLVQEAFTRPTLRLLNGKWAAVQVAVLRIVFDQDRRSIPTNQLHAQVDALLDTLRAEGLDGQLPPGTGRELCRRWMNRKWLVRLNVDDGGEVYELTSYALEALELVQTLSSDRPLLSESRLAAILDAVRRQAIDATPDAQSRIDRLNQQVADLTAERDRLAAGGEPEPASVDRMMEGYDNLVDLIGQLPSDFKRVEEGIRGLRDTILAEFRNDARPLGQLIDEYLARSDDLLSTPEGRAFDGALRLLRDDVMLTQLKRDLEAILAHPFTAVLTVDEIRAFRGTVTMVRRGLDDVLAQRRRLSGTLRDHIVNHDAVQERELADTLKALHGVLTEWIHTTSTRAKSAVELLPDAIGALPHLRERFYDPGDHVAPEPLGDVDVDLEESLSLEQIRQQGGPLLARLRAGLSARTVTFGEMTAGSAFNAFPDDLRRPVEALGILHLLSQVAALDGAEDHEPIETIRADGTRRGFTVPRVSVTRARAAELADLEIG
ncbi:MAG: DUF3375 family protein [Acidimicrobiia bacterium]